MHTRAGSTQSYCNTYPSAFATRRTSDIIPMTPAASSGAAASPNASPHARASPQSPVAHRIPASTTRPFELRLGRRRSARSTDLKCVDARVVRTIATSFTAPCAFAPSRIASYAAPCAHLGFLSFTPAAVFRFRLPPSDRTSPTFAPGSIATYIRCACARQAEDGARASSRENTRRTLRARFPRTPLPAARFVTPHTIQYFI
ncbi:hypothetical protein MSAN_01597700 [Mycena sanguinolenta]|uniref:Uncharacterized protein n=1 Tax=Mycena sanguinolenta TaxID=230812 RepID=A0A8H6Y473_9AGAR|nr:hypothetical protein MSAN_01597700 [Mycena sanguinolenta]